MDKLVKIEAETLMGNTFKTYFVDLVVNGSHGNLRSFENVNEARAFAREYADANGPLRVVDETYAQSVLDNFRAQGAAQAAIYKAKAEAAVQRATKRAYG
jgi:hypothetical protein